MFIIRGVFLFAAASAVTLANYQSSLYIFAPLVIIQRYIRQERTSTAAV
jgi:hypothetical protein